MINRLLPGKVAYTDEFIKGMEEFIKFSYSQPKYLSEKVIRCSCKICKNIKHFTPDEVNVHIFKKGFTPGYWYWASHGEESPSINMNEHVHSSASTSHQGCIFDMSSRSQSNILAEDSEHVNRYQGMVYDADDIELYHHVEATAEESPNMGVTKFYEMLNSAQEPLWPGYKYSELSIVVRMMSIKSEYNMSHGNFNSMEQLMKHTSYPDNKIPLEYYRAKNYGKKDDDIRWLDDKEIAATQLHVLINCDEVKTFIKKGNKADWWVVIKTNPKGSVDTRYNLEVAYQEEQSRFSSSIEDDPIDCLHDDQADGKEVDKSSFQAFVNKNEHDIIEERNEDISNEEEKGDEETSSEEANDEEEETNEEEDFFYSEDSTSHFHTQE
ncbi:hypothetical protein BC332_03526 [Capsicum chinense]|nr:hypothetical protein BC332_03526 [Capsicum chinense]